MTVFLRSPSLFTSIHCSFGYPDWCQKQLSSAHDTDRHSSPLSARGAESSAQTFGNQKVPTEKMRLLFSQGLIVTGQEVRDTSCSKENTIWMQEKNSDSEDNNTLEKVAQRSDGISVTGNIRILTWHWIPSGKDPAFNSSLDLMIWFF